MKIKIITDRKPWVNNAPHEIGAEIDVSDADGKTLIDLGFAEAVDAPKARRGSKE